MSAAVGCATTTSAPLAAAQGGEDAEHVCAGIPAKERELGLLSYRGAIGGTTPMMLRTRLSKSVEDNRQVGVRIALRAQPGLTAPWLSRVAACHVALAAAKQLEATDAKDDPLLVPGVQVSVEEAYTGFIVSVRAPDAAAATDVNARAVALSTGPTVPATARAE
jgi:hypothetical protein